MQGSRVISDSIESPSRTIETADTPVLVASILPPVGTTGVQTHFGQVLAEFNARGFEVESVTPFNASPMLYVPVFGPRKLLESVNRSVGVWWYFKWHRVLLTHLLRRRLRDGAPRVVYVQSPPAAEAALRARRNRQQVVVLAIHYGESESRNWVARGIIPRGGAMDRSIRAQEHRTIPRVDGLVAVSDDNYRALIEEVPEAASVPHRIVPNFLKSPAIQQREPTRDVITIGTLEQRKNQRYLVEVIAEARALDRDVTATILGDGDDRRDLEMLAQARGVSDLIEFTGYVPEGARLIPDHRLYVHSALYESFCIAAAEGLAYGRPVIAGAVGGLPEVFDDGVEGRHWPLDSPRRGAEMLIELLSDEPMYERMSAAARQRFEARFDADVVVPRLYGFLQQIGRSARN